MAVLNGYLARYDFHARQETQRLLSLDQRVSGGQTS